MIVSDCGGATATWAVCYLTILISNHVWCKWLHGRYLFPCWKRNKVGKTQGSQQALKTAFISSVLAAMLAHCSEVMLFQMQQRMCVFPEAGTMIYCTPGDATVTSCRKCVESNLEQGTDLWAAVGASGVQTGG